MSGAQDQFTHQQWLQRATQISTADQAHLLWKSLIEQYTPQTVVDYSDDVSSLRVLSQIWKHTQTQTPGFEVDKLLVQTAVALPNFLVLTHFLREHDTALMCQHIRLLPAPHSTNALQETFRTAVQHNEVEFVRLSLPYVPKTDHRGHSFLPGEVLVAAKNAHHVDDPLLTVLWDNCSSSLQTFCHALAQHELAEVPSSPTRQKSVRLIEEKITHGQRLVLRERLAAAVEPHHNNEVEPPRKL